MNVDAFADNLAAKPFEFLKQALGAKTGHPSPTLVVSPSTKTTAKKPRCLKPREANKVRVKGSHSQKSLEVSSATPVYAPSSLPVNPRTRKQSRDPRFSEASGKLDVDAVARNYDFINELRKREGRELKERLATADSDSKEVLKRELERFETLERQRHRLTLEREVRREAIKAEEEQVKETGKLPFMVKRRELKARVTARWSRELRGDSARKLEKADSKRERKAGAKLKRKMPKPRVAPQPT